jgi:hypothetical protein
MTRIVLVAEGRIKLHIIVVTSTNWQRKHLGVVIITVVQVGK